MMSLLWMVTAIVVSLLVTIITYMISWQEKFDYQKASTYECGFDPRGDSRVPFSLRFYLLTILFIIFDVEIALLFPFLSAFHHKLSLLYLLISFLVILIAGLLYEWSTGALDWQ